MSENLNDAAPTAELAEIATISEEEHLEVPSSGRLKKALLKLKEDIRKLYMSSNGLDDGLDDGLGKIRGMVDEINDTAFAAESAEIAIIPIEKPLDTLEETFLELRIPVNQMLGENKANHNDANAFLDRLDTHLDEIRERVYGKFQYAQL